MRVCLYNGGHETTRAFFGFRSLPLRRTALLPFRDRAILLGRITAQRQEDIGLLELREARLPLNVSCSFAWRMFWANGFGKGVF